MFPWLAPKPFIIYKDDKFQLNNEVIGPLLQINKPLITVCIAGRLRSGKSFLMNRLVGKKIGFPLGSTIEAVTKGVWVWYLDHPLDKSKGLLVMDSEGLEDPEGGYEDYDMWILCICILLSSTFIYNEIGLIGSSLIDRLGFVSRIKKRIKTEANETSDANFDGFFPHFVLVIRDLSLDLKINGKDVSDDEYMEQKMLTVTKCPSSSRESKRNETKLKLRKYFSSRKCFTFVSPLQGGLTKSKKLEEMSEHELPSQFVKKCSEFNSYIFQNSPVKALKQVLLVNGSIFVQLATIYLDTINKKCVPCIENAINLIAESENIKALEESMSEYNRLMSKINLPLDKEELEIVHTQNHKATVEHFFKKACLDDEKKFHEILQTRLANEYIQYTEKNRDASRQKCEKILEELYKQVTEKLTNGAYIKHGGYEEFNQDIESLETKYNSIPKKGALSDISLQTFLISKTKDRDKIVHEILTESEKELEMERLMQEKARLEAEKEKEKEEQERLNEATLRRTLEEQLEKLLEKHQTDLQLQKEAYERIITMREKELKRLLRENFDEEAKVLRDEIDDLRTKRRSIYNYVANVAECLGDMISDALTMMRNNGFLEGKIMDSTPIFGAETEEYINKQIFPILTPGLKRMIHAAKLEKCFERRITKFRPLDFLTEYLYNNNPKKPKSTYTRFEDIHFVRTYLSLNPRLPIPKFLAWTDEDATRIIQAFFRGYLVRRQPQVQELREYQKDLRIRVATMQMQRED